MTDLPAYVALSVASLPTAGNTAPPPHARPVAGRYRIGDVIETIDSGPGERAVAEAAQLLHDFSVEYDEPAPPPDAIAARLETLIGGGYVVVLLARDNARGTAVGVAVIRVQPSLWTNAHEAYVAELTATAPRGLRPRPCPCRTDRGSTADRLHLLGGILGVTSAA
jgi:hypothetical protein